MVQWGRETNGLEWSMGFAGASGLPVSQLRTGEVGRLGRELAADRGRGLLWGCASLAFSGLCADDLETQQIAPWLKSVADGVVSVTRPDDQGRISPDLSFIEPNLAFSVATRVADAIHLRVHFSQESTPPDRSLDERFGARTFFVEVVIDSKGLREAANQWEQEIEPFPGRGLT